MKVRSFLAIVTLALLSTTVAASAADQAPDKFRVKFETSAGDFVLEVVRKWAPKGADRFYELVQKDFYKDTRFFRVVPNFVVQWGINGDPEVNREWKDATIKDDPVVASNLRGYITFAKKPLPDTRTTQLFINLVDNQRLDEMGFAPFGRVVEGMEVVDKINAEYGGAPSQDAIQAQGNAYLKKNFPNMDYIKSVKVMK
jgi:peptidyl-prolyl cis-trans isomerase A (cyclophilin A)